MADNLPILVKNGEITGKPMYQVRGDPQWHSTPKIAQQVHDKLKKAEAEGFFKKGKK